MAKIIKTLADYLKANVACSLDVYDKELLGTIQLSSGRSQKVKLVIQPGKHGQYNVAKCISRACVVEKPNLAGRALMANAKSCGGYSLDTSVKPPALDIMHSVLVPVEGDLDIRTLFSAVLHVATVADRVEKSELKLDVF